MASYESLTDKKVWANGVRVLKKKDKSLAKIINKFGNMGFESSWSPSDPYEAIIVSFLNQQISGAAAASILKKFKGLYNGRLPAPREFLKTPENKVRSVGISPQKYSYIKNLCERLTGGELDLNSLSKLPDEEVIAVLDDVRGIGRWTAEMFLMFNLRRVNVFPLDDLGIQNAVKKAYGLKEKPSKERMLAISSRWGSYKSIASLYLWRSQD